jgi:integrase
VFECNAKATTTINGIFGQNSEVTHFILKDTVNALRGRVLSGNDQGVPLRHLSPKSLRQIALKATPDRSTLKGKRDYVILALLVGCALRRNELAELDVETIQQREGRWVLADLEGKGRRIRTVAIPIWVKQGINAWMTAAGIEDGRLLRSVSKSGKVNGDKLSDWAIWSIVEQSSKQIGIEHFGAHDLRRTCAKL